MSNANKPAKVLRVAFRRIQKGWTKGTWVRRNKQIGVTEICLEAAIFGYKKDSKNPACLMAKQIVLEIIQENYETPFGGKYRSIPEFNDAPETTYERVEEVVKLALIRAETGGLLKDTEGECYVIETNSKLL